MIRKLLAVIVSAAMFVSLTACAAVAADEDTSEAASESAAGAVSEAATPSAESAGATTDTGLQLMKDGTLTVGMEIGYPPFEDFAEDGTTPIGYDVDFAKALAEKLGLEVNFINTAWDGIFQGIDVNYDCAISAVTITAERQETMLFSDPYINNYQAVLVMPDFDGEINGFLDLDGLAVAVQKETTSDILISDYVNTGSIKCNIIPNEKVTTCFTQLANGEVDAVVVDSTVADYYIKTNPGACIKIFQDDSEPEYFGVAMGMKNTALQAAINEAIAQLTAEGFIDENYKYWFGAAE
jgi:polar amino acid transport system substrate-binding protein